MKAISLIFLSFSVITSSLMAQGQEDVPPKHFRFITLGELPVWKEELRDGIRVGLEPPKGSMPPKEVSVLSGESAVPLALTLRSFSEMVTVNGATPQLVLQKGEAGAGQNWLAPHKMPTAPLTLGVLYRDPANMTWDNPKVLLVNDTPSAFPGRTVRFANVSDRIVLVQIGDPEAKPTPPIFGVRPGQTTKKPLEAGNNQIRVGYLQGNEKVWIWENQIRLLQNQRLQAFFYKTQGDNPRQLVKFHFTAEPLPQVPGNS